MNIDSDTEILIRKYYLHDRLGLEKTANKLGHTSSWLVPRLKRLNITIRSVIEGHRQFTVNEEYFSQIDGHGKAYCLGFLYADGCITEPHSPRSPNLSKRLQVVIQYRDIEVLEFIKKDMQYTGPILKIINLDKREYCRIVIPSNQLCEDLIKLGCHPRKSLVSKFPTPDQIPAEYLSSFICGFFDGDGGYKITYPAITPNLGIGFAISYDMGITLKQILMDKLNIRSSLIAPNIDRGKDFRSHIWVLSLGGNQQSLRFSEWIYSRTPFKMTRKYNQFLEVRKLYDNNLNFIKTEEWIKMKIAQGHASLGRKRSEETRKKMSISAIRGHRKSFVELSIISPDGKIHHSNCTSYYHRDFLMSLGLHNAHLSRLMREECNAYKGWTKATPEQVAEARANNTLIEKIY